MTQLAAKVDYLDRVLADYGSQAEESRAILRTAVEREGGKGASFIISLFSLA